MELIGIHLGRRSPDALDRAHERARGDSLTDDHVGSTLSGDAPTGVTDRRFDLTTPGTVAAARSALRRWATHAGIGAGLHPSSVEPDLDETVLVTLPFGPFELLAPNRVVAIVDERDRYGFAYGTLPGHPEAGEELFLAEAVDADHVRLTVRIHARPATLLTRLGGPLTTAVQSRAARRYLSAWSSAITEEPR